MTNPKGPHPSVPPDALEQLWRRLTQLEHDTRHVLSDIHELRRFVERLGRERERGRAPTEHEAHRNKSSDRSARPGNNGGDK